MASDSDNFNDNPHEYTTQEIGQMLFDMQLRQAKYEKKMMSHKLDQEAFTRQQAVVNQNIDDSLAKLTSSVDNPRPPDSQADTPATRGWTLPPSVTRKPIGFDPDMHPKLTSGPPRFNGDNVITWIRKIQKYYNHSFTPLHERLYMTSFLFDDAA